MNDELRNAVFEHVINRVEGGVSMGIMQMIDEAIEEGYIDHEQYCQNEDAVLRLVDDHVFECTQCGWTMPVSEIGEDVNGELACEECSPIEY